MSEAKIKQVNGQYVVIFDDGTYIKCHNLSTARYYRDNGYEGLDRKPWSVDWWVAEPKSVS